MELIERLEKASGPSRELDAEIAKAADFWPEGFCQHVPAPAYTASLDAAMTLVPSDQGCGIKGQPMGDMVEWFAWVDRDISAAGTTAVRRAYDGTFRTLPLALCIAALRART